MKKMTRAEIVLLIGFVLMTIVAFQYYSRLNECVHLYNKKLRRDVGLDILVSANTTPMDIGFIEDGV